MRPTEGQEVCVEATEQRVGLARALYEARAALSCLFLRQPQVTLACPCQSEILSKV